MTQEIEKLNDLATATNAVVSMFNDVLLQMDDLRQELAEAGDWEALIHGLKNLNEFKQSLTVLVQSIEKDIYDTMPEKKMVVEGLGVFEKRRSSTKKWDSEAVLDAVVRNVMSKNETGEIGWSDVVEMLETLKKVLPLTSSLSWRVNELKKILDPDFYCEVSWGRPTIQVTK